MIRKVLANLTAAVILGNGSTSVTLPGAGTLSIMVDKKGSGYAAWNGGPANGMGIYAKTFWCALP